MVALAQDTEMTLTEQVEKLRGLGETVSLKEVEEIYLPLSRLLNLYVEGTQNLHGVTNQFLGSETKVPFIIGVAGSVAVGKGMTSRILRELLARWPSHPQVQLLTTDGFLYPNAVLEERDLMQRRAFPKALIYANCSAFCPRSNPRAGAAPVYSHIAYDILPDEQVSVAQPDILIVEGLNVPQPAVMAEADNEIPFVSDYSISQFILMPRRTSSNAGMLSVLCPCAKPPSASPALISSAMPI